MSGILGSKFFFLAGVAAAASLAAAGCGDDTGSATGPMGAGGAGTIGAPAGTGAVGVAGSGAAGRGSAGTGVAGAAVAGRGAAGVGAAGSAAGIGAAGSGGMAGEAGAAGTMAAAGAGAAGMAGSDGAAGMPAAGSGAAGAAGAAGDGMCCDDGDCLCHGPAPAALTSSRGPFTTMNYSLSGVGCVYYPTDAEPPFAAVAISDGYLGSGGCGRTQTDGWGTLYASHGIVAMIVVTGSGDQPAARGRALTEGIAAFKAENMKSGSPLMGKLAGRYGTSGFSMGGGGTSYASRGDATLRTSVAVMPWGPVNSGIMVPTLVICGASDGTASCGSHGTPMYRGIGDSVPKMRVTVSGGHNGQPSAGGGDSGEVGLAFQKVFLEGDERWRPLLVGVDSDETNIE